MTALLGALPLCGQMSSDDLVSKSPFVPDGWTPGSSTTPGGNKSAPAQYEFRGVYSLAGVYYVNVVDRSAGRGEWMQLGSASKDGIKPTRYDADSHTLTAMINGQSMDLQMPAQSVSSHPVATAVHSAPGRPTVATRPGQPPQPGNQPTTLVRRVNRIPPPPPPTATNRGGVSFPRAPGVVRTQNFTPPNTGASQSQVASTGNNGVITGNAGGITGGGNTGNNGGNTGGDNNPAPNPAAGNTPNLPEGIPPPPSFIPQIPPELQQMIKNRQSPGGTGG